MDPVTKEVRFRNFKSQPGINSMKLVFMGLTDSPEHGGTGLPNMVWCCC
jgi:hypothetical protein